MTEGRTKQTLNAPLPFYGGGIKMRLKKREIPTSTREMNVQEGYGVKKTCMRYNKVWQNMTLTSDLLTQKSIGIFLSLSSICV